MTPRARRPLAALATLAAVALTGAGCATGSTDTGTSTSGSSRAQAVRFAQCMRDHGVPDFPDPDASGELTIDGIVNGSSLDPDTPAWKEAGAACKDLQPAGFTGRRRTDQEQESALAFARCIREHGVADFPDPVNGAPLVDTNRIPSSATDGGMDVLDAAMRQCGDLVAKLVAGER